MFSKTHSRTKVKEYLSKLSGRRHFVYGGITVISSKGFISKLVKTEVFFNNIPDNEINNKILVEEGVEKQEVMQYKDLHQNLLKNKGSYTNVVGLSLSDLYLMLKGMGFKN